MSESQKVFFSKVNFFFIRICI